MAPDGASIALRLLSGLKEGAIGLAMTRFVRRAISSQTSASTGLHRRVSCTAEARVAVPISALNKEAIDGPVKAALAGWGRLCRPKVGVENAKSGGLSCNRDGDQPIDWRLDASAPTGLDSHGVSADGAVTGAITVVKRTAVARLASKRVTERIGLWHGPKAGQKGRAYYGLSPLIGDPFGRAKLTVFSNQVRGAEQNS